MALAPGGVKLDFQDPQTFDECWIDSSETPEMAQLATDQASYFEAYVIAACQSVNRYCARYFNQQQADEVIFDEMLNARRYRTFVLRNKPLVTVDNIWLQINESFNEVSLEFIQIDTEKSIIKILPDLNTVVLSSIPFSDIVNSVNLWVRYTSGYEIAKSGGSFTTNDVPQPVRKATAMMVKYMFDVSAIDSGKKGFETQTYSEDFSGAIENDPKLMGVKLLLSTYRKRHFIGSK